MNIQYPPFGYISGLLTTLGLLPRILFLWLFSSLGANPCSILFLSFPTLGSRVFSEWLFWSYVPKRLDLDKTLSNWRSSINQTFFSHPNVAIAVLLILVDTVIEIGLIYLALKTSFFSPAILLIFLGCQAISAPIQGVLSDYFNQKNALFLTAIVGILSLVAMIELSTASTALTPASLLNLTGLSSLALSTQMLVILCIKGLLGNLAVIARAAIADIIKVITIKKLNKESIT